MSAVCLRRELFPPLTSQLTVSARTHMFGPVMMCTRVAASSMTVELGT